MAKRNAAGTHAAIVTPALRAFQALSCLRDGDHVELQFPPDKLAIFGEWALDIADKTPSEIDTLRPPWAYAYDPFTFPDIIGYLQPLSAEVTLDPATYAVRLEDTPDHSLFALHSPIDIQCLVDCINVGVVYDMAGLPLTLAVATLATAALRMPDLCKQFPPRSTGPDTEFDRNIYFA